MEQKTGYKRGRQRERKTINLMVQKLAISWKIMKSLDANDGEDQVATEC